jgi:hypothetical protein
VEKIYGVSLAALTAIALVFYPVFTTYRRNRALSRMPAQPPLSAEDLDNLRLHADGDTHVIERGTVTKAVGEPSDIEPRLRRSVLNPRRHRYPAELDAPKALRAHDHNTSGVST